MLLLAGSSRFWKFWNINDSTRSRLDYILYVSIRALVPKTSTDEHLQKSWLSCVYFLWTQRYRTIQAFTSNKIIIITNSIRIDLWLCISRKHAVKTSPRFIFAVEFVKICRYKTFRMRIFERTTFLLFRYCSIHVKLCVLATYSARNWV